MPSKIVPAEVLAASVAGTGRILADVRETRAVFGILSVATLSRRRGMRSSVGPSRPATGGVPRRSAVYGRIRKPGPENDH